MKITVLHRKQQVEATKAIKNDRKAERVVKEVDIDAQIARARVSFVASRDDLAARAAKAKASFQKSSPAVMLG